MYYKDECTKKQRPVSQKLLQFAVEVGRRRRRKRKKKLRRRKRKMEGPRVTHAYHRQQKMKITRVRSSKCIIKMNVQKKTRRDEYDAHPLQSVYRAKIVTLQKSVLLMKLVEA